MKTRIVWTKVWEDEFFANLNQSAKILFLYLITNSRVNLCGCYEISDRVILFDTHISAEELETAKKELAPKAKFCKGWVFLPNSLRFGGYSGPKNEVALEKEVSAIPKEIRHTLSIPYGYGRHTPRNKKSEIRNQEPQIRNQIKKRNEDVDPKDLPEEGWLEWQKKNKI